MDALTKMMTRDSASGLSGSGGYEPGGGSRRRWLVIGGAVVAIAAVLFGVSKMMGGAKKELSPTEAAKIKGGDKGQEVPTVTVIVPGLQPVSSTVEFTGTIAARYDMPISVEGDGGRISQVLVEAGDRVGAGQVLARLNTSVVRPQVEQLAASLEEARASAALAAADYERARQVAATGALSREEIDRRRAAAATAAARAKVVAAQLNEARARLARTDIRAPSAGLVLVRNAEVGQTAMAGGEPLFRMAQGGQVEMGGQVAEQDLPALKTGQSVSVSLTGVAQPFIGRIRLLGAVINPQTRLGTVRVALDSHPLLRPGAFAKARAQVGDAMRPVLPQTAVLVDAKGPYVYTVGTDNKVIKTPVTISGATRTGVIISTGLSGQEQVVSAAGAFLNPGEVIKPALAKPATR